MKISLPDTASPFSGPQEKLQTNVSKEKTYCLIPIVFRVLKSDHIFPIYFELKWGLKLVFMEFK